MARLLIIPVVLLALLTGAMIWSRGDAQPRADFVYVNQDEVGTLDPRGMSWTQDLRLSYALWEGLWRLDPVSMKPVPGTADRIELSPDRRTYTLHIRENARWSNGDPVLAGDFVFAWRRMLEQPGNYGYLFHYVEGAQRYKQAFADNAPCDFEAVGIRAVDPHTLRVTLAHPVVFFADLGALPPFFPMHEPSMRKFHVVDSATGRVSYDARFTRPPNLVTNGPYRLEAWEFRRKIRLVASDHYWNKAAVKCRTIDVLNFSDARTALLKYETGGVDWLSEINDIDASDLIARGRTDVHVFPGFGTSFYALNCLPRLPDGRSNPLADVRVRRALVMAIDKRPIVQNVARLNQPIATSFVPPGAFEHYIPPAGSPFDPKQARGLLAEAKHAGGEGLSTLSILYNESTENALVAQIIRKQWLDTLGVRAELSPIEAKIFRHRVRTRNYDLSRASWVGDYNDVSTFLDKFRSDSDNNQTGWSNPRYDQLCQRAAEEPDLRRRLQLYREAEQILCDEAPIIPLYHYVSCYLYRDNVRGLALDPRGMLMFHALEVRRP